MNPELRQAISGEVINQLQLGSLDVGFYLATSAELNTYLGKKKEQFSDVDIDKLAIKIIVKLFAQFTYRVLAQAFEPLHLKVKSAALVDQEASMRDLVRSGVGLSLVRDSIAMHESQSRGLVIADKVSLSCTLCFVYASTRSHELVIGAAHNALDKVWS